jgi:hypothetical protein
MIRISKVYEKQWISQKPLFIMVLKYQIDISSYRIEI